MTDPTEQQVNELQSAARQRITVSPTFTVSYVPLYNNEVTVRGRDITSPTGQIISTTVSLARLNRSRYGVTVVTPPSASRNLYVSITDSIGRPPPTRDYPFFMSIGDPDRIQIDPSNGHVIGGTFSGGIPSSSSGVNLRINRDRPEYFQTLQEAIDTYIDLCRLSEGVGGPASTNNVQGTLIELTTDVKNRLRELEDKFGPPIDITRPTALERESVERLIDRWIDGNPPKPE